MSQTIKSTEYDKFQFIVGNRPINWNHVERLKREMLADPEWFEYEPMLVNEGFFILDGQHSYLAAKDLGHPLFYKMRKGATLENTRRMNFTRSQWSMTDFAKSFAASGRKDYIDFLRLRDQFPQINNSIMAVILAGGQTNGLNESFRRGSFKIRDKKEAVDCLEKLNRVYETTGVTQNTPMAMSFLQLLRGDNEFDFDRFMRKLEANKEMFVTSPIIRNSLRTIEDIYNHQSKSRVRLY